MANPPIPSGKCGGDYPMPSPHVGHVGGAFAIVRSPADGNPVTRPPKTPPMKPGGMIIPGKG